jgi:hypothetical protein
MTVPFSLITTTPQAGSLYLMWPRTDPCTLEGMEERVLLSAKAVRR